MRIGVLTTGYPHAADLVSGIFVRELNLALVARGHTITVVCAAHRDSEPRRDVGIRVETVRYRLPGTTDLFDAAGAPERIARDGWRTWANLVSYPVAQLARARSALAECDALVSHFVVPSGVVGAIVRDARPHLAIAHGSDGAMFARLPAHVRSAVLSRVDTLWVTHHGLMPALAPAPLSVRSRPATRRPVVVAPMGVVPAKALDAGERARVRAECGVGDRAMVLAVGRMIALKGIDVLLAAAERLGASASVVVAGDGPERTMLERRARSSGVSVRFLGAVDARRRDELLASADVFAAPARVMADGRTESAPVAIVEAMAAGLAVVASCVGGIGEVLGDAGVLVRPEDPDALAAAIGGLIADPARRASLGARASERASAWSWERHAAWVERALERAER